MRGRRASPGFSVSPSPLSSSASARGGISRPWRRRILSASAQVLGSGTVGPEAMSMGSSPGTSDSSRFTTRAGWHAAASRPPLMADRCRRTQFISLMLAPLASRARLSACLSPSVSPGSASGSSDEPPPEIRHSTRSSCVSPRTRSSIRRAAVSPAASGTGWAASTISMRLQGTA